jgi:hypothetical protein
MSTKIYEAYLYRGGDIYSLFRAFKGLRRRIWNTTVPHLAELIQDPVKWDFVSWMDDFREVVRSYQAFAEGKRGNFIENPACSAVVYPYRSSLYVQFFGVLRYMYPLRVKGLVDYHYQNQCDKPDEVSNAEWRTRKRVWDAILGDEGVPSVAGLSYEFIAASDNLRIASEIFKKLHGHDCYPMPGEKPWESCKICQERRKLKGKEVA